jgi:hypothetical protein
MHTYLLCFWTCLFWTDCGLIFSSTLNQKRVLGYERALVTLRHHRSHNATATTSSLHITILRTRNPESRSLNTACTYIHIYTPTSSVWIEAGYGQDGRSSIPGRCNEFFLYSTASRPTPGLTQSTHKCVRGGSFLGGTAACGMKLTTHLQLVPSSRMVAPYLHFPIRLYGVVLN